MSTSCPSVHSLFLLNNNDDDDQFMMSDEPSSSTPAADGPGPLKPVEVLYCGGEFKPPSYAYDESLNRPLSLSATVTVTMVDRLV